MKSYKKPLIIGAVSLLLIGVIAAGTYTFLHFTNNKAETVEEEKEKIVSATVDFTVNAEGWDQETSSPIPIHVTGQTADNKDVDEKYFIGHSEGDLTLQSGTYTVEVYASPINADGTMYCASEPVTLDIPTQTSGSANKSTASASASPSGKASSASSTSSASSDNATSEAHADFTLTAVPPQEITEGDISKAQTAMQDAGIGEEQVNAFIGTVRQVLEALHTFANMANTYSAVLDSPASYVEYPNLVTSYTYRLLDINGDGFPELLLTYAENNEHVYDILVFTTANNGKELITFDQGSGYGALLNYGVASAGGYRGDLWWSPSMLTFFEESHSSGTGVGTLYMGTAVGNTLVKVKVKDIPNAYDWLKSNTDIPADGIKFDEDETPVGDRGPITELAARSQ